MVVKIQTYDFNPYDFIAVLLAFSKGTLQIFWVRFLIATVALETGILCWAHGQTPPLGDSLWWAWKSGVPASAWMMLQTMLIFSLTFQQNYAQTATNNARKAVNDLRDELGAFYTTMARRVKLTNDKEDDSRKNTLSVRQAAHNTVSILRAVAAASGVVANQMTLDQFRNYVTKKRLKDPRLVQKITEGIDRHGDVEERVASASLSALDYCIYTYWSPEKDATHMPTKGASAKDIRFDPEKLASMLNSHANVIAARINAIQRLQKNRIPFFQLQLLGWIMLFLIFTMPFSLVAYLHWYALPSTIILTWGYTGFYFSVVTLSQPYGSPQNWYSTANTMSVDVQKRVEELDQELRRTLRFHFELSDAAIDDIVPLQSNMKYRRYQTQSSVI